MLNADTVSKLAIYKAEFDTGKYDSLVSDHIDFVKKQANRFKGFGVDFEDLTHEGVCGLLYAAKRFDWSKGYTFLTFAASYVKKAINVAIAHNGNTIKVPIKRHELQGKIRAFVKSATKDGAAHPTVSEIAFAIGVDANTVADAMAAKGNALSLDAVNDAGASGYDYLDIGTVESVEDAAMAKETESGIMGLLAMLNEREQYIVRASLGLDDDESLSLAEIGRELNLTRERVRMINKRAMEKLTAMAKEHGYS